MLLVPVVEPSHPRPHVLRPLPEIRHRGAGADNGGRKENAVVRRAEGHPSAGGSDCAFGGRHPPRAMGREEAKEQSKEAQRAKEMAAFEKKQAQRDKQWQVGAKDSSSQDDAAAKAAEAAARKAERKAIEDAEGAAGAPDAGNGLSPIADAPARLAGAMGKNTKPKVKDGEKKGLTKAEKAQRAMLAAQALEKAEKEAAAKAKAAKKAGAPAPAAALEEEMTALSVDGEATTSASASASAGT